MTSSPSQTALTAAALAYAGTTVFGSCVAVRDDVPGEPFGISIPLDVRSAVAVGWGTGIAPPWFMPAGRTRADPAQPQLPRRSGWPRSPGT